MHSSYNEDNWLEIQDGANICSLCYCATTSSFGTVYGHSLYCNMFNLKSLGHQHWIETL